MNMPPPPPIIEFATPLRQFQQQQLEQLDALLANYNWSFVFNTSGIDRKVNTFLQITENMISE